MAGATFSLTRLDRERVAKLLLARRIRVPVVPEKDRLDLPIGISVLLNANIVSDALGVFKSSGEQVGMARLLTPRDVAVAAETLRGTSAEAMVEELSGLEVDRVFFPRLPVGADAVAAYSQIVAVARRFVLETANRKMGLLIR